MEDSGETVNLAVLDQSDHQAIIIDQVQCTQLMRTFTVQEAGNLLFAQLREKRLPGAGGVHRQFSADRRRQSCAS
jgi:hypothetical protein